MTVAAEARAALDRLRCAERFERLGVAVSGGSDSTALLHLARDWAEERGVAVEAVTVDHGLRPEAAHEARLVGRQCAALGVPHEVVAWTGWSGRGNLQDAARRARRGLIADWAARRGLGAVALGHTRDDQAETVLLRLARGSGVDGLSAMAEASGRAPRRLRPLLGLGRAELRAWLTERAVSWSDDPSNEDPAYDRVKARRALKALAPLGLDAAGLADTAGRMRLAREALEQMAWRAAREAARLELGDAIFDGEALSGWPEETRLRLVAHAIGWISGVSYRPRLAALRAAIGAGVARTLGGALLMPEGPRLRLTREHAAVARLRAAPGELWDGRWRIEGPARPGDAVAALGAAVDQCPDRRSSPLPRASLTASPAVWRAGELVAAPLAGLGQAWSATLVRDDEVFYTSLLSR